MAYQTVNPANNQLIKQYAAHSDADVEAALERLLESSALQQPVGAVSSPVLWTPHTGR